jgi:TonB family protein
MKTITRATVVALAVLCVRPAVVVGQEAGFQPLNSWVAEPGAHTSNQGNALLIQRGTIRTTRIYSDFVLRFEFRLSESESEGRLFVRSRFGYDNDPASEHGYRIALTNKVDGADPLGRVSGSDVGMTEVEFHPTPPPTPAGRWQECEIGAERGKLTVRLNGVLVSTVQALDEFAGYIALQSRRGDGIEVRNIQAKRVPSTSEPFGQEAHRASEPGVNLPRALKTAKPFYPREPYDAGVQGAVSLELVVDATGLAGDVRVLKSLHPDLDEAAIASARQWRFAPGTRAGQPVAVVVTMDVTFQLRK